MYKKKEKLVAVLQGFEKDPGEEIVIEVKIGYVPVSKIRAAFKEDLNYGDLILTKKHEPVIYKVLNIKIDTNKLDFFLGLRRRTDAIK